MTEQETIDLLQSFDARDWAKAFVKTVKEVREQDGVDIAVDEETMTGWFANAIMRGYDEAENP